MSGRPSDEDVRRMARESVLRHQKQPPKGPANIPNAIAESAAVGSEAGTTPIRLERPKTEDPRVASSTPIAIVACVAGASLVAMIAVVIATVSLVSSKAKDDAAINQSEGAAKQSLAFGEKPASLTDVEKLRQSLKGLQEKLETSDAEVERLRSLLLLKNNRDEVEVKGPVEIEGTIDVQNPVQVDGTVTIEGNVGIDGTVSIDGLLQTTPIKVEIEKVQSKQVVKTYSMILGAASLARSLENDCKLIGRVQSMVRVGTGSDETIIVVFDEK